MRTGAVWATQYARCRTSVKDAALALAMTAAMGARAGAGTVWLSDDRLATAVGGSIVILAPPSFAPVGQTPPASPYVRGQEYGAVPSPDGRYLIAGIETVTVWDSVAGKGLWTIPRPPTSGAASAFLSRPPGRVALLARSAPHTWSFEVWSRESSAWIKVVRSPSTGCPSSPGSTPSP